MNRYEKGEGRFFGYEKESPSFSSSLLDQIYRSIDDDDDLRLLREAMSKKKSSRRTEEVEEDEEEDVTSFRRACLIEKWMDKKVGEKVVSQRRRQGLHYSEPERRFARAHRPIYADANDAVFFSSASSSSDSSSGGFSSSDTDSIFGAARSAPARPKPVRTSVAEPKLTEVRVRNGSCYKPQDEEALIKSKSRALKIYNNLKKVKQPISPGGKLSSFLNSLFANSSKKSPVATAETPAPSSASSFSRSCLSKNSSSNGGLKRSVRFYPVSVIVDEDSRPCGHKSLYGDERTVTMPVSVPTVWKIVRSSAGESDKNIHRKVEQVTAMEILRDYKQNQKKNESIIMKDRNEFRSKEDVKVRSERNEEEDDDDDDMDDAASYSSSDLFELDHLAEIGKEVRYQEELPVYETTRVDRNRPIF